MFVTPFISWCHHQFLLIIVIYYITECIIQSYKIYSERLQLYSDPFRQSFLVTSNIKNVLTIIDTSQTRWVWKSFLNSYFNKCRQNKFYRVWLMWDFKVVNPRCCCFLPPHITIYCIIFWYNCYYSTFNKILLKIIISFCVLVSLTFTIFVLYKLEGPRSYIGPLWR